MFNLKENIMAPSWFLFPLFCIPFLFFFLRKAVKNDGMLFLITFLLFITATLCRDTLNQIQWNNCAVITNLAIGLFIFTCGFVYGHNNQIKHYLTNGKYAFELFLLSVFILFEAKYYWNYSCNMRAGTFSNTVWTFILCPAGICFLIYFSHAVVEKGSWIKKILTCIGKRSMSIMFFHVLSFSLVTLAGIYLFHSTYEPSWTNAFHGTWYPYINAGVGLTVPLAADFLIETIRKKERKSISEAKGTPIKSVCPFIKF